MLWAVNSCRVHAIISLVEPTGSFISSLLLEDDDDDDDDDCSSIDRKSFNLINHAY